MSSYADLRRAWLSSTLGPTEAKEAPRARHPVLAGGADAAPLRPGRPRAARPRARPGGPGPAAVHARHPAEHVSGPPLDDAAVRRVRDGRRVERALPLSPR